MLDPQWGLIDARLEFALGDSTLDELTALQESVQRQRRSGLTVLQMAEIVRYHSPQVAIWLASRGSRKDDSKVTMLLGALSVAIAWQTYRARSAPENDIRRAMDDISAGITYTLPIPRHRPCFCGSENRYRDCHGRPPVMGLSA